jgi:hypothetical protein
VSGKRARAYRAAAGGLKRPQKAPTALIERSYIQAPVSYDPVKREYTYRSGGQVRRFLAYYGVDVDALQGELQAFMAAKVAEEAA